jgi:hypothetical protein
VQSFQELSLRFIASSKDALALFVRKQHGKLVQQVCSLLREERFQTIQTDVVIEEDGNQKAQFDVIATKNRNVLHVECKTLRTSWRTRMYLNPLEWQKEAQDFIGQSKLSEEEWKKKLGCLDKYVQNMPIYKNIQLLSIVVTDMPTPASNACKNADILWVAHLKDYIHKML